MEFIEYKTDEERRAAVKEAQGRGLSMFHDDFHWTGMVEKTGEPIIQKVMTWGTSEEEMEKSGKSPRRAKPDTRLIDLQRKMQTEDLTLQELNELKRLGG